MARLKYSPELAAQVCDRIRSGQTLRQIAEVEQLPKRAAICDWLGKYPEFADQYARAREDAADHFADQIIETVNEVRDAKIEPDAGRVIIDGLKWAAGKRKPKVYGDRVQTDVNVTVTLRDLVSEAAALRERRLIDVSPRLSTDGQLTDGSGGTTDGGTEKTCGGVAVTPKA